MPGGDGDDPFSKNGGDDVDDVDDVDDAARSTHVEEAVRSSHPSFVEAVAAAGRVTADSWDGATTRDRSAVVDRFEAVLRETGTLSQAPAVLETAVDAAGGTLQADPVPSPPYVAITSRGVLLRATTQVGRVVVQIAPFVVDRDPVRYAHRDVDDPAALLSVSIYASRS